MTARQDSKIKTADPTGAKMRDPGPLFTAAITLFVALVAGWFGVEFALDEASRSDSVAREQLGHFVFLGTAALLVAPWLIVVGLACRRNGLFGIAQDVAAADQPADPAETGSEANIPAESNPDLEDRLRTAKERFRSLAASIPGVIYQRRVGPDGDIRYTYISEGAKDLFGVDPEEIISDPRALFDCHGPDYRATFRDRLLQASRDLTMWDVEAQIINRNGEEKWTHAIARPKLQPDGAVLWDGIILDATRMKRAELELHSAKEQAESANRAKSEFLAVMSHEIRTPLNGVLGMAELLSRTNLDDRQKRFLTTITQSGESLLSIVNDILDITKIEAGEQRLANEVFGLSESIAEVAALFRGMAEQKGLALHHDLGDDLPDAVEGDPVRLRQVLANVINNAVKFTSEGKVEIRARLQSMTDHTATVVFEIEDTGIGVPANDLPKLFDAFHQVDSTYARRHGGTGLGLTITHRLVEMMGGEIRVDSEEGAGSTFSLVIPLSLASAPRDGDASSGADTATMADAQAAAGDVKVRVLVAEDNPVNKEVILEHLWAMGCVVDTAENGVEAVEAFEQNHYDIVLMDCQMPQMDGFEATRKIREVELIRGMKDGSTRHTPIIAVSAYTMAGDREHCLLVGMDDHLGKPFTFEQIQQALTTWLRKNDRAAVGRA